MKTFKKVLGELLNDLGLDVSIDKDEIEVARKTLDKLNKYFYQKKDEYISPYHEYWKDNHSQILNITINVEQAKKIAKVFEDVFAFKEKYPNIEISPQINKEGLSKSNIANVRFFTAIQDFKINIYKAGRDPFQKYLEKPEWFTASLIVESQNNILDFLKYIEATGSQGDKRQKWMLNAAQFLLDFCDGDAFNLFTLCKEDVIKIRELIADGQDFGYSRKKADMFIRDMIDWGVWNATQNLDKMNVASDTNTMRVALRTGLLEIPIPLLASYLDVYCYQYSLVDSLTQSGWRTVWEEWRNIPENHCPSTPASMDYLLYKSIGKANCKQNARKCDKCLLNEVCPKEKRNLKPPKSISILGLTGWESGRTDGGGGGGIMA